MRLLYAVKIFALTFICSNALASSFEDIGFIESIDTSEKNLIVNGEVYSLPSTLKLDNGNVALYNLFPGYQIGFSGKNTASKKEIESIFLYPDSIIHSSKNLRTINHQKETVINE